MNCPTCGQPVKAATNDSDEADFEKVVEGLRKRGFEAEVHASGGGIDVIRLVQGSHIFYFGTAAEQWGADVYDESDENHIGEAWTAVSSTEKNPEFVADAIAQTATEYERS
jgi:hypothetical protein